MAWGIDLFSGAHLAVVGAVITLALILALSGLLLRSRRLLAASKKHFQERAQDSERVMSDLQRNNEELESVNSVILRWASDGTVLFMNKFGQDLFGFSEEELVGKSLLRTFVPETASAGQDLKHMIEDLLRNPFQYVVNENENVCKNGDLLWMAWRNKPMLNRDGSLKEILTIGIDITERKRMEEQLREAREELEKRNRFIRQTFGRYLSDDIVESILETPEGLELGGEERKVTIMMTDIRGFTSLAERLPPENVVSMLNIYLEAMTDVILKHKGTIDEFIGDAILVIFGAPLAYGADSKRAVACAVEMQLAMKNVNTRFRESDFPEIGMGIGLRTGEVVVGNIGSSKRSKYGVVGHNVNLASRIESYTVAGQILACEGTLQECGPILRIDAEMEVVPKGVDKPITIYEIGGIGGDYNSFLPEKQALELTELDGSLSVQFWVIAQKDAGTEAHPGEVIAVSLSGAKLRSEVFLPVLKENLKLTLRDRSGTLLSDAIYAKVLEHTSKKPPTFVVHFTSVPPATESFLETLIAEKRGH